MTLSSTEIQAIKSYFSNKPVQKAFVFGSYSRDEASADSVVDLLVELDYSQHIG
ncbi:MAG: nucleotidyltransferase [Sphingobacteriales bacterium]|nr:nucleotidyltransferase [Sphingobacteriales bacterium]